MRNPEDFVVSPETSLRDAMKAIDRYGLRIVFVAEGRKLLGSLSDGDVRRFLLQGGGLEDPVSEAMNPNPKTASVHTSPEQWSHTLDALLITALPLMDGNKLARIYYRHPIREETPRLDIPVVIQAGGKGTRLKPYTDVLPKPLIPVAGKTITEHIMDRCMAQGCHHFEMIINYRKNLIRAYFEDQENPYDVHFIEEESFAGTAGGLRLVLPYVGERFLLHNCDILVDLDFQDLYDFHRNGDFALTMVGAEMTMSVPYGTVQSTDDGEITKLEEKPGISFVANTGLYLIERRFLDYLGEDEFVHITDVISRAMDAGEKIGVYKIPEHAYLDMGQHEGLERMAEALRARGQV